MRKVPPIYRHVYYFFFEDIYILRQQIHIKQFKNIKKTKLQLKKKVIIIQAGSHIYFKLIVPCVHKINNILIHHQ